MTTPASAQHHGILLRRPEVRRTRLVQRVREQVQRAVRGCRATGSVRRRCGCLRLVIGVAATRSAQRARRQAASYRGGWRRRFNLVARRRGGGFLDCAVLSCCGSSRNGRCELARLVLAPVLAPVRGSRCRGSSVVPGFVRQQLQRDRDLSSMRAGARCSGATFYWLLLDRFEKMDFFAPEPQPVRPLRPRRVPVRARAPLRQPARVPVRA